MRSPRTGHGGARGEPTGGQEPGRSRPEGSRIRTPHRVRERIGSRGPTPHRAAGSRRTTLRRHSGGSARRLPTARRRRAVSPFAVILRLSPRRHPRATEPPLRLSRPPRPTRPTRPTRPMIPRARTRPRQASTRRIGRTPPVWTPPLRTPAAPIPLLRRPRPRAARRKGYAGALRWCGARAALRAMRCRTARTVRRTRRLRLCPSGAEARLRWRADSPPTRPDSPDRQASAGRRSSG
jgi:hypothetical protein